MIARYQSRGKPMNSRERVRAIVSGDAPDRCGFWLGNPAPETWNILYEYFRTDSQEVIRRRLGDDVRWISPGAFPDCYQAPDGRRPFQVDKKSHGQAGPFADCEDVEQVERYDWPETRYLDFDKCIEALKGAGDVYRASGLWSPFFHIVMDLFGMENYLVKMYECPEVVIAVTDHVCRWHYEANERFLREAGDLVDAFFFGNDFGTQLDLIVGPVQFDQFILPWFKRFTEQGHRLGHQVILHSCGSIYKVIDRLIDAGVDCLHPLQAKAANMDAETLSRDFKGRLAFMGGIDTQDLLVNGSPGEVAEDVRRVKKLLGPRLIVSPSHEAILPNVPPENIVAMSEAALEQ